MNFDRISFSRTITLIESSRESHKEEADLIMKELLKGSEHFKSNAIRIGICGAPGAGKSSLIEKLGIKIVEEHDKRLAVLAIDPSSERSGGSILGDKTRMNNLSFLEKAYVRPSPTRGFLGGVSLNTSEVMLLCERTGFEVILVETVGVGQSEIEIDNVVDFVVYVVPPGSGDGLQGSKKGVMEIADLIVVNKYDTEFKKACERSRRQIKGSISLTRRKHDDWEPSVELVSAKEDININKIWEAALEFKNQMGLKYIAERRNKQKEKALWRFLSESIMSNLKKSREGENTESLANH